VRPIRAVLADDRGNAIIEFIFVAVIVMVPLVYLIVSVADIERTSLATGQAAREAGRAFATGDSTEDGLRRATVAARLALSDQGLADEPALTFHAAQSCSSAAVAPVLAPGAEYTVCVERTVHIAGVPSILAGRGIRTIGEYRLHVDDYRSTK
jgi:Flp pilus assembly protein TadG